MRRRTHQLSIRFRRHGGARTGAGRTRAGARANVPHRRRAAHDARHPVHVTLRAAALPRSLRMDRLREAVRRAIGAASRADFRVLEFSIQSDHLHLIVEGDDGNAFTRGVQGLAIRIAKAVNRVLGRRGSVWADRHHARALRTPREMRNALVYVLTNWRKHVRGAWGLDPASSARWFSGWTTAPVRPQSGSPVVPARSWLARWGWRRHGLLDPGARPAGPPRRR